MKMWTMLASGVVAGAILAGAVYVTAAPAAPAAPVRIGVIDFGAILQNYNRMKDSEKVLSDVKNRISEEYKARSAAIEQSKTKLQMHTPDSDAYAATQKDIIAKSAELQAWQEMKGREVLDRQRAVIRDVYGDVERGTADYAKTNGLTLVLKSEKLDLSSLSARDMDFRVSLKQVIYCADEMDITEVLTAMLNLQYEKQKLKDKASAPAPAPAK